MIDPKALERDYTYFCYLQGTKDLGPFDTNLPEEG